VRDARVLRSGFNEGNMRHDPTAHAKVVVIGEAYSLLQVVTLEGAALYCTLQPCGMCTVACVWAGVSRVVHGAGRTDVNAVYFETRHANTVDFIHDAFRSDIEVEGSLG